MVKQWDATLDGKTRDSHRMVDGEIRELNEKFSNGLMYPGDPSGGAAEVVNCRCALLQRVKWNLGKEELNTLKKRAEYFGLDKTKNFEEYKGKYLKAVEKLGENSKIESDIEIHKSVGAKFNNYAVRLPDGSEVPFTEGTRITNIKTIAGKGRERQIDMVDLLVDEYGGSAEEWQKKKGIGYVDYEGESYKTEVHWYEEPTAGRHNFKVKSYNGEWIIDEEYEKN